MGKPGETCREEESYIEDNSRVKKHGGWKMEVDIKGERPLAEIIPGQIKRSRRNSSLSFKADTQSKRNKQLVLLRAREWEGRE